MCKVVTKGESICSGLESGLFARFISTATLNFSNVHLHIVYKAKLLLRRKLLTGNYRCGDDASTETGHVPCGAWSLARHAGLSAPRMQRERERARWGGRGEQIIEQVCNICMNSIEYQRLQPHPHLSSGITSHSKCQPPLIRNRHSSTLTFQPG